MVGSNIDNFEAVIDFLNTINNLEKEYKDYFEEVPKEIIDYRNKLEGIKENNVELLNVQDSNLKLSLFARDFIMKIIEDLETEINIKKRKGIDFTSEIKDLRKLKRKVLCENMNIGESMVFYRENFNEDIIERINNKVEISLIYSKKYWIGLFISFILGVLTNYLFRFFN